MAVINFFSRIYLLEYSGKSIVLKLCHMNRYQVWATGRHYISYTFSIVMLKLLLYTVILGEPVTNWIKVFMVYWSKVSTMAHNHRMTADYAE